MAESLSIREVVSLSITIVTDNYYDALRPDTPISKRFRSTPGASLHAEHGFCCVIHTAVDCGDSGCLMFDYGVDGDGIMKNIQSLGVELSQIDALVLSHGHFDHWAALPAILERGGSAICPGTPLYVGREAFLRRFARPSGGGDLMDLGALGRDALEVAGILRVIEITEPTQIIPGAYATGHIDRVTSYEHVPPAFMIERDGRLAQDLFEGEQAIVFAVKGKGLVVLSGCAHAGIVNTVLRARELTGIEDIYAIIGGFHLVGADRETIEATIAGIEAMSPDYIVPTHCTGFEAMVRFSEVMPDRFLLNTVGTTYTFGG